MTKRDVELVIKAKNEATKNLDTISDAVDALEKSFASLSKTAPQVDKLLGDVTGAFAELNKQVGGASPIDRFTASLATATSAVNRLEKDITDLTADQQRLAGETAKAEQQTKEFAAAADLAKARVVAEGEAVAKLQTDFKRLGLEIKKAEAEQAKASASNYTAKLQAQAAAVDKASLRLAELSAKMAASATVGVKLKQSVDAASRSLDMKRAALDKTVLAEAEATARANQSQQTLARLRAEYASTETRLIAQTAALNAAGAEQADFAAKSKAAETSLKSFQAETVKTASGLSRAEAALNTAQAEFAQIAVAASKAGAAMGTAGQTGARLLSRAVTALVADYKKAIEAKQKSQSATADLAKQLRNATGDTKELSAKFVESGVASRKAKQEYLATRDAVFLMRRELREAGTDINKLVAAQSRISSLRAGLSARISQIGADARSTAGGASVLKTAPGLKAAADAKIASRAAAELDAAAKRAAGGINVLNSAVNSLFGGERKAMSFMQRLRGELVSLALAYGGIYGAISQVNEVYRAIQAREAAVNRLAGVFDGDQGKVAQEYDFLRRTAERLGISIQTVSEEYSRFAIASKGTVLEGEKTRKIFLAVSEAGRVNKLTNDQLKGTFYALTQIMSKGKITAEELSQQLGDRFPGAIQIMAASLKVTSGELLAMMKRGELTSEALSGFADELNRRFGPQLATALKTLTTEVGRLQFNLDQANLTIADGGLAEGLMKAAQALNEFLTSAQGDTLLRGIGSAAGFLVESLAAIPGQLSNIAGIVGLLIGFKLAVTLRGWAVSLIAMRAASAAAATAAGSFATSAAAMGTASTAAAAKVGVLTGALRVLLSASGLGLVIGAIGAGLAYWSTRASAATEALVEHKKIVDQVKNAYDAAGGSVDKWKEGIDKLTLTQLEASAQEVEKTALRAINGFNTLASGFYLRGNFFTEVVPQLRDLEAQFKSGKVSAEEFRAKLDEIGKARTDANEKTIIADAITRLEDVQKVVEASARASAAVDLKAGRATAQTAELFGVALDGNASKAAIAAAMAEKYKNALGDLKGEIPSLAKELQRLDALKTINAKRDEAIAAAGTDQTKVREANLIAEVATISQIYERKKELASDIAALEKPGVTGEDKALDLLKQKLKEVDAELTTMLPKALLLAQSLGAGDFTALLQSMSTNFSSSAAKSEKALAKLKDALTEIKEEIPGISEELARLKKTTEILDNFKRLAASSPGQTKLLEGQVARDAALVNVMFERKQAIITQIEELQEIGGPAATAAIGALKLQLTGVDAELAKALEKAIALATTLGDPVLLAKLQALKAQTEGLTTGLFKAAEINRDIASATSSAFITSVKGFAAAADGAKSWSSALREGFDAFRTGAAEFLYKIAEMIAQQAILNALQQAGGATGGAGGVIANLLNVAVAHDGRVVGRGGPSRTAPSAVFANAQRYHNGGFVGFGPREVPIIAERNEEVITRDDPRHAMNGGAMGGKSSGANVKVVNVFDPADIIDKGLTSTAGEKAFLNFVSKRPQAFRKAIGV